MVHVYDARHPKMGRGHVEVGEAQSGGQPSISTDSNGDGSETVVFEEKVVTGKATSYSIELGTQASYDQMWIDVEADDYIIIEIRGASVTDGEIDIFVNRVAQARRA